jgi:hypothetical protein
LQRGKIRLCSFKIFSSPQRYTVSSESGNLTAVVKGRASGFSKERSVTLGRNAALYFRCRGTQVGILRPFARLFATGARLAASRHLSTHCLTTRYDPHQNAFHPL